MHTRTMLLAGISLLPAAARAQFDHPIAKFNVPAPITGFTTDEKVVTWIAGFADDKMLLGGSIRAQNATLLTASNPLAILQVGRNPWVVQEQGTDTYHGLTMEGDWASITLPAPATQLTFSENLFGLESNGSVYIFNAWEKTWLSEPMQSSFVSLLNGRAHITVVDGKDIVGFSVMHDSASRLVNPPGTIPFAIPEAQGEPTNRRNAQAYEIGSNTVVIYSAYTHGFVQFNTTNAVSTIPADYDKNVIYFTDGNDVHFYSATQNTVLTRSFADTSQMTFEGQDFGVTADDPVANEFHLFRAIDAGIATLTGVSSLNIINVDQSNNQVTLSADPGSGREFWACASSVRGAQFVAAGMPTSETVLKEDGNDNTYVVATDQALYGFSAFSNSWTVQRPYAGTFVNLDAEDFIGWVTTDSTGYVFNPREDKWTAIPLSGTTTTGDSDQMFIVTEPGSQITTYSMESNAPRVQAIQGALFQAGTENSYTYSIHDDASTGGSAIYFFQSLADQWVTGATAARITDPANVVEVEDGLLISADGAIYVYSGYADLSSVFTAPIDNYAYHAQEGNTARFLASGTPGAAAALFLGVQRTAVAIPAFNGELLVNPLFAPPVGVYDSRGILRFELDLTGVPPAVVRMQMGGVDVATPAINLGRLLNFEIF